MHVTSTRAKHAPSHLLGPLLHRIATLILTISTVLLSIGTAKCDEHPRNSSVPNIVLILADDMGYGDASCYGNAAFATPHLDALAAEGMRFTDFHSSGAVCSPTRAGLVTGRYQQRAGIPGVIFADPKQNRHHGLHANEVTFAELLQAAGYATAVMGKWHLGYQKEFNPVHHGFDRFRGYVSGNVDYLSHYDRMGIYDWWDGLETVEEEGYTTHLITRHAVRFIEENKDRPFCLYVAHEAPHSPWQGPHDAPVRGPNGASGNAVRGDEIKRAYREMIQEMDKGVGEMAATIERLGLAERTLVFFFSDNGGTPTGSNGPLRGHKGQLWEGGHRVPAIAWWPGHVEAGTTCDEPAISLDLMPTLLALAGVEAPEGHPLDGVSLLPALLDRRSLGERALFWSYRDQLAMREGPWKLVATPPSRKAQRSGEAGETVELFNLADDLGETRDLAKQFPDRARAMREAIRAWEAEVATGATRQPEPPLD
ncbi:MAG TPA: sulfatase-like hydrolase/transferase [Thermoguttaceae bacterium]|nr:sulfatase-like hydrolase/transferase [Thermoguttaceae bacterium]